MFNLVDRYRYELLIRSHLIFLERFVVELGEEWVGVFEELLRIVELFEESAFQNQNSVAVDDGVESVGHCDDCAVLETLVHRLVNDRFRRHVDVGRRLVNQNDSGWLQNGAGNADQLSLTNAEVLSVFGDLGLKALATVHRFLESGSLKGAVQVLVSVLLKRVKVLSERMGTSRMVPAKRQGSCRMMVIFERRSSRLSCEMSRPSSMIFPSAASRMRRRHNMMVDLPEPVLPTTPILWPPVKVTLSPLSTRSRF